MFGLYSICCRNLKRTVVSLNGFHRLVSAQRERIEDTLVVLGLGKIAYIATNWQHF